MKLLPLAFLMVLTASAQLSGQTSRSERSKQQPSVRFSNPSTMAKPVSNYSQVVEVPAGKTVYIAGQVGIDSNGKLVGDDFRSQAEQIFKNLKLAVESSGGTFSNIVKINYYVSESVDPSQYAAIREIRDRYVGSNPAPASTFVVVKRLVRPEYLLEVEAVAAVNEPQ